MPSIKTCLASLAFVALAFAPVNASVSHSDGSVIAARDANHHARRAPESSPAANKRSVAAAAARAAHEKRQNAGYSANGAFLSTKAAKAAAAVRCNAATGEQTCKSKTTVPKFAHATCESARCTFRCNDNYRPYGTKCITANTQCAGTVCPTVDGGYNSCGLTKTCTPSCYSGSSLYRSGSTYRCFSTAADVDNCGAPNKVCPQSYNNVGTPKCLNSQCSITCPAGTSLRKARSTSKPYTCY